MVEILALGTQATQAEAEVRVCLHVLVKTALVGVLWAEVQRVIATVRREQKAEFSAPGRDVPISSFSVD